IISFASGCVVKPFTISDMHPDQYKFIPYVDSFTFNDTAMMQLYGYKVPTGSELPNFFRTFVNTVPFVHWDRDPRPSIASNFAFQSVCLPKVESNNTIYPVNVVKPVLRTQLLHDVCESLHPSVNASLPGFPLLVAFINHRDNFEDGIIFSSESKNDYAIVDLESTQVMVGEKFGTFHGQKGVISKIVPKGQMPRCRDPHTGEEFVPHLIIASSSISNRETLGQLIE
ncbi:hypothetical protein BC830DRAFT_1049303, partial [Chytriomyces sp. MP71]